MCPLSSLHISMLYKSVGPIPKLVVEKSTMQYISSSLQKAQLIRSLYHVRLIHCSIRPFSVCRYKIDQIVSKRRKRLGCGQANDISVGSFQNSA